MKDKYLDMLGITEIPLWLKKYLTCSSLERLKNVGYFCGMDYASKKIYDFGEKVSRYDHSLSVALLTWKLTNDKKATLAGLFHDVGTPCFSHVIDYMNKDYEKQESTEENTFDVINRDSYLLNFLSEDDITVDEVVSFKNYSIVDLDRPMLCADRLDGVILTGMFWTKSITIDDVKYMIDDIEVMRNEYNQIEIGFKNIDTAMIVLRTSELIDIYCHSNEDNYMMELLAKITRRAIEIGIINYEDLYLMNEDDIFRILDKCIDIEIEQDLNKFRNIGLDEIEKIDLPNVKIRNLNPMVLSRRIK